MARVRPSRGSLPRAQLGYWGEDLIDAAMGKARELYDAGQQATQEALAELRAKVAQFEREWASFKTQRAQYAAAGMSDRYDSLYSWGSRVEGAITGLTDSYASLKQYVGLGILPVVGAVAVAGVVAAIVAWLAAKSSADSELVQLVREGKAPASVLTRPSVVGEAGNLVKWLVIGAVGILVVGPVLKKAGKL